MLKSNIYYFKKISKIGGTELFLYEIAKRYYEYDITIFYDEADEFQLKRLRQYLKCKKHFKGEKIKCDKAFLNFNIDIIDDVEANEYYFVSHAIYQEIGYHPPINHPKLTHFIGVSQYACDKLKEYADTIGMDIDVVRCYNPISLEPREKVIHIVSAGRLDDETKDNGRTLKLINALDRYTKEHNRHYIWTIFSNPINFTINSPNVVLMKPRVDVRPYIADADFVVQLSNDMETYCYTNNEALGYGVKIITTPLTVNKELNIPKEANLICEWDMSNVDEIAERIFEEEYKEFKYNPPKDGWINIINKTKSNYEEELKMRYLVEALPIYQERAIVDNGLGRIPNVKEQWEVDKIRLDELLGDNSHHEVFVKVIKEIKPVENAKLETKSKKKIEKK